jgi:hypothetical protein
VDSSNYIAVLYSSFFANRKQSLLRKQIQIEFEHWKRVRIGNADREQLTEVRLISGLYDKNGDRKLGLVTTEKAWQTFGKKSVVWQSLFADVDVEEIWEAKEASSGCLACRWTWVVFGG